MAAQGGVFVDSARFAFLGVNRCEGGFEADSRVILVTGESFLIVQNWRKISRFPRVQCAEQRGRLCLRIRLQNTSILPR